MSHTKFFIKTCAVFSILFFILAKSAFATTYTLPTGNNHLIGQTKSIPAVVGDNLVAIAARYGVGMNSILAANPDLGATTPIIEGREIKIPTLHLLPQLPYRGIVINLSEMRLYYYPDNGRVMTYPIGIGRVGKTIPIAHTAVVRKVVNPVWIPPEDIRAFDKQELGVDLPKVMPAGPDNPLGPFAIYLRIPTYLIHSTIYPDSIGRRESFGCIRMHEEDIKDFFPSVKSGIPVTIVDMPTKVGWNNGHLYLETYPPLEEHSNETYAKFDGVINDLAQATDTNTFVDWQLVAYLGEIRDGVPHDIGFKL